MPATTAAPAAADVVDLDHDEAGQPLAYRPADAARVLGVHRATIYELLNSGELTARKAGARTTLIPRAELQRYLDSLPTWGEPDDG